MDLSSPLGKNETTSTVLSVETTRGAQALALLSSNEALLQLLAKMISEDV